MRGPFLPTGRGRLDGRPKALLAIRNYRAFTAGEAMVEPPNVKMIGYNRSTTEPMRVVTFYVSDPDTPFLDLYVRIGSSAPF